MVRIRFPPAESPQTIGSSAAERDLPSARDEPALRRGIQKPCGSRAVDAARIGPALEQERHPCPPLGATSGHDRRYRPGMVIATKT